MTERACAICVKRQPIPGRDTGLGTLPDILECRARPPASDISGRGRYPQVQPDDYCHSDFQLDADASKTRRAELGEKAGLDRLVTQTQSQAAETAQLELGSPAAGSPEAPAADPKAKRARRARGEGERGALL